MKTPHEERNLGANTDGAEGCMPRDLEVLLSDLPAGEARRLEEVWRLAGPVEPGAFPSAAEVEAAARAHKRAIQQTEIPSSARLRSVKPPSKGPRSAEAWLERLRRDRPAAGRRATPAEGRLTASPWLPRAGTLSALVVLAVAAGLLYWWAQPVVWTAGPSERIVAELPDGSTARLNSGSTLQYVRRLSVPWKRTNVRRVVLEGEAFFDVAKRDDPFIVQTFNAEVRVLGTRFAVRAWPSEREGATTVALMSGQVGLAPFGEPGKTAMLAPGEVRRIAAPAEDVPARVEVAALSLDEATAWLRGSLIFKDAPLSAVAGDVERRFGITLALQSDALAQERISLALRQPGDAETVVRDLTQALSLRYRPTATGFEIYDPAP